MWLQAEDFLIGGFSAVGTVIFTNPLEMIKIRMQLQGELKSKGQHAVYYKNVVHAAYVIIKNDGLKTLQKGLLPAVWYQFLSSGFRLGKG